jgi:hypothetical protein
MSSLSTSHGAIVAVHKGLGPKDLMMHIIGLGGN